MILSVKMQFFERLIIRKCKIIDGNFLLNIIMLLKPSSKARLLKISIRLDCFNDNLQTVLPLEPKNEYYINEKKSFL